MNKINLYTHMRMGDLLICYGFIKEYAKQYDEIHIRTLNVSPLHVNNIKRLYSSLKNVKVFTLEEATWESCIFVSCSEEWFQAVKHWYDYSIPNKDKKPFTLGEDMIFDRFWYNQAKVPFNLKWDNFYFERDLNKEKEVYYNDFGLKDNEEFIFLHEDPFNKDEDRTIKRKYINPDIKLIDMTNYPNVSILDTTYTIEHSKEVHVINSTFLTFIDLMNIQHNNLNYHKYCRANPAEQVGLRLNWNIIEE